MDEDGYVFLADRRTDLILRGGANIYPAEVEAALYEHPGVGTAVVVGVPDTDLGARVHAIVQPKAGEKLTPSDLHAHMADKLARYKCPESYEFSSDVLRDDAGKVRRSLLRAERAKWLEEGKEFRARPV